MTFRMRQTSAISSFNSWYFCNFSSSLSFTLSSPGIVIIIIIIIIIIIMIIIMTENSTVELLLPTDDVLDLLNLCLTSTYFQYNGKH